MGIRSYIEDMENRRGDSSFHKVWNDYISNREMYLGIKKPQGDEVIGSYNEISEKKSLEERLSEFVDINKKPFLQQDIYRRNGKEFRKYVGAS